MFDVDKLHFNRLLILRFVRDFLSISGIKLVQEKNELRDFDAKPSKTYYYS